MKKGDTIKCHDAQEMLEVASALAQEGIITKVTKQFTLLVVDVIEGESEI